MNKQQLLAALEAEAKGFLHHDPAQYVVPLSKAISLVNQLSEPAGWQDISEPTEAMCDAARSFLLSMEVGIKSYEGMKENFERLGEETPFWMRDREGHLTKWDKADCIWRLMASALPPAPSPEQKG